MFKDGFERIALKDLIATSKSFNKGDINSEQMKKFGEGMTIRPYIPLLEKMGVVMSLLTEYQYSNVNSPEIQMAELYKNLFFKVILEGYAVIDCSQENLWTYDNYDLLCPIFEPFVLAYCQEDYNTLLNMLRDSINMYYNNKITEGVEAFSTEEVKKGLESNAKLLKDLQENKEVIKELNNILNMNDPYTKRVAEEMKEIALNN